MSDDPDLVITAVDPSLRKISKPELRRKLVSFLAVSLPPIPLSYVTFEAHIKAQCETYYDSVIKEVYESLTAQWNQRLDRAETHNDLTSSTKNDPITISSDEESESENHEPVEQIFEERESMELGPERCESKEQESDECEHGTDKLTPASESTRSRDVRVPPIQPDGCEERSSALTDEELLAFKAEKCTKKYTRYLQETYDLIKNIERTTSCNICCKLKRRIQKFVSLIGQESAVIQQKVATELRAHRISPKGNLTEAALEKMRMSILIDKLIEISMPDILKGVELVDPKSDDGSTEESETKEKTLRVKKKRKKKSEAVDTSADVPSQVKASCSTEPSNQVITKKRTKKSTSASEDVETPLITKRPSQASLNGSCSGSKERASLENQKSAAKKKDKKTSKGEETSTLAPRAKARKISIKIRDSNHPDLD